MTREEKLAFLERIAPWAQRAQELFGIPASVTLAQAILESADARGNWGASVLATDHNNFFGIKANSRLAPDGYCELATTEFENGVPRRIRARFARFRDPRASFEAHARLLSSSPRYAPAMTVADDPVAFAVRLQECGYSTNPEYAKLLIKLIRQWELTKYDLKPRRRAPAKDAEREVRA